MRATGRLTATISILAALRHAERTGEGQQIDISLLDCLIALTSFQTINYFVSGQVPTDDQGQVVVGGIEAQTRQVFQRVKDALALADCTLADVAKVSVWLADARDFGSFNRVYMECFGDHRPARSTVESRLMIDAKIEMDVTAYKPR